MLRSGVPMSGVWSIGWVWRRIYASWTRGQCLPSLPYQQNGRSQGILFILFISRLSKIRFIKSINLFIFLLILNLRLQSVKVNFTPTMQTASSMDTLRWLEVVAPMFLIGLSFNNDVVQGTGSSGWTKFSPITPKKC